MRLAIPRRVYAQAYMDVVAEGVLRTFERRQVVDGLRMVYEPDHLRLVQARCEFVSGPEIA